MYLYMYMCMYMYLKYVYEPSTNIYVSYNSYDCRVCLYAC